MALYFNKSPEQLSESEIKEYLLFLKDKRKLADGTFRFYYSGIKFLYKQVLKRDVVEGIRVSMRNKKLPVVLDLSEVEALFGVTENITHRAILMLTYSAGLRISETTHLKITGIDSKGMMVHVRQGKRGKNRYAILSQRALKCPREYWRQCRPREWLFEGQKENTHITVSAINGIFQKAKKRAGRFGPSAKFLVNYREVLFEREIRAWKKISGRIRAWLYTFPCGKSITGLSSLSIRMQPGSAYFTGV